MSIQYTEKEFDSYRQNITIGLRKNREISDYTWDEIKRIEIFPGSALGAENIVVPIKYLPANYKRKESNRTVNLNDEEILLNCSDRVSNQRLEWLHRALLALWLPSRGNVGLKGYAPSTWLSYVFQLLRVVRFICAAIEPEEGNIWAEIGILREKNFHPLTSSDAMIKHFETIIERLLVAAEYGLMLTAKFRSTSSAKVEYELTYKAKVSRVNAPKRPPKKNIPAFSDEFVAEFIARATWVQDNIAMQAIDHWAEVKNIGLTIRDNNSSHRRRDTATEEYLSGVTWVDAGGEVIQKLPFRMRQRWGSEWHYTDVWRPGHHTLNMLMTVIQDANASTIAFTTGARSHEILDIEAPREDGSTTLDGTTYKYSGRLGGAKRDWPLHPIAEKALRIQQYMARSIRPKGQDHLWFLMHSYDELGSALYTLSNSMKNLIRLLDLGHLIDGNPHMHRWRHTVARLIARTVDEAQQVLQDLLGHDDLEVTLQYMLSDPELVDLVLQVLNELAFVLAQDAITEIEAEAASGPAATHIGDELSSFKMRRGIDVLGTDDLTEAAAFLTVNGIAFRRVKHGIICTKTPDQFGPCTKARGRPDPGACRPSCHSRLELRLEQSQCEQDILSLDVAYVEAVAQGQMLLAANLEGQVCSHLSRWPALSERLIASSATLRKIWSRFNDRG